MWPHVSVASSQFFGQCKLLLYYARLAFAKNPGSHHYLFQKTDKTKRGVSMMPAVYSQIRRRYTRLC